MLKINVKKNVALELERLGNLMDVSRIVMGRKGHLT